MTPFVIFYGNGARYSGPPERAPTQDCQAIVQPMEDERYGFVRLRDWYWWEGDRWSGGDYAGLLDYLWRQTGWQKVLAGRTLSIERFQEIYQEAKALRDEMNR